MFALPKGYFELIRMSAAGHIGISLFHIFVIVPFFLYIAFVRGQAPPWIYTVALGLGLVVLIYHLYKVMVKWRAGSPGLWVNMIHFLFVGPLLIFIGAKNYDTPRWGFEVLAMTGFAALGYHIYSIVMNIQDMQDKSKMVKKMMEGDDH